MSHGKITFCFLCLIVFSVCSQSVLYLNTSVAPEAGAQLHTFGLVDSVLETVRVCFSICVSHLSFFRMLRPVPLMCTINRARSFV